MSRNSTWSVAVRNAKLNAMKADFDNGYIRIYSGTQPAGPDTAPGAQILLAELRFGEPAFTAAIDGVLIANSITPDPSARTTGTASWYRCLESDGVTTLHDGAVGKIDADAIVANTAIIAGAVVECSEFTITEAAASALNNRGDDHGNPG